MTRNFGTAWFGIESIQNQIDYLRNIGYEEEQQWIEEGMTKMGLYDWWREQEDCDEISDILKAEVVKRYQVCLMGLDLMMMEMEEE